MGTYLEGGSVTRYFVVERSKEPKQKRTNEDSTLRRCVTPNVMDEGKREMAVPFTKKQMKAGFVKKVRYRHTLPHRPSHLITAHEHTHAYTQHTDSTETRLILPILASVLAYPSSGLPPQLLVAEQP